MQLKRHVLWGQALANDNVNQVSVDYVWTKNNCNNLFWLGKLSTELSSSETQGQIVGSIKCSWWKFSVRSRRAPGHLLLPNQFQRRLNCLLLIGQKNVFLANQRREAAAWLLCFLIRRSFPHRSPWLLSAFNGECFSGKVSEQNVNNLQKLQLSARLQEAKTLPWIFKADLSEVS